MRTVRDMTVTGRGRWATAAMVVVSAGLALVVSGCQGSGEAAPVTPIATSSSVTSSSSATATSSSAATSSSTTTPVKPTETTKPKPPAPAPAPPGGWPGPDNTGWRHTGVQLQPVACSGGEFLIDKPGTLIDGKSIPCSVRVVADGVKITRSKITASGQWGVYLVDKNAGLVVQDVEIVGSDRCEYGVGFEDVSSIRINVSGCSDGVKMERGSSLVDSWIHDLSSGPGDHNDGVQITGGSNITIRHNRIENPRNQTSAILVGGEFGSPSNIMIENNFLNGGNYTVYLDPKGTNRVIRNNTFTKNYVYGPARLDGQVEWTGNVYEDGSAVRG